MNRSFYHYALLLIISKTAVVDVLSFQSPTLKVSTTATMSISKNAFLSQKKHHHQEHNIRHMTQMNELEHSNNGNKDINLHQSQDDISPSSKRRQVLKSSGKAAAAIVGGLLSANSNIVMNPEINAAHAADELSSPSIVPFGASWKAVDGLNSLDSKSQFVSFDMSAYKAMRDDATRTPQFQKAIENRLGDNPEDKVVVDLGTGPFALFAIIAAQLGAKKVYAIEASPEAAQSARAFVKKSGYDDIVTVLEGFSTDITLEEKADFCIAEIVGSIASEEGAYATIRSAHENLVKEPNKDSSWIPSRIQTYAAPASYTLHNLFGPPEFDWDKLNGEPVRFNCRDKGLGLLADPVLVEDISFAQILSKEQNERNQKREISFKVDAERMEENQMEFFKEFRRGNSSPKDSEVYADKTAHSMTGIALWPRIILDDSIVIDSRRFGDGGHQKSHWQSVLPIMNSRPIGNLKGGEQISVTCDFTVPESILTPPSYSIKGNVKYV